ncbi:PQQ-dependent sugar dehydrogenase [Cellulosilyticum sp. I15G10I2]|uniref:PQQ-dependent sugar dehydrogenase n=1 Tax=Cellulosilyticum sp. I15G10I2 TaxID=1892843 RepID=UPI00085C14E4|nr:PQQ-dependent sugar dehydrogenase [Cellulosilyticum sp. I15G10I2]
MKEIIYLILFYIIWRHYRVTYAKTNLARSRQLPYEIEVVAENLHIPWGIAISDEGKIYFTERSGAIRVIEEGELQPEPIITLGPPFVSSGEGGLMGIALDPDFSQNHYMYVMHTYNEGNQIYNRVIRLIKQDNRAIIDQVLIEGIPGGRIHNGGRIKIGPDQKLYIATGDAGVPALAQERASTAGKILRIALDGSIPEDNPIPNSPVYSLGHRNPQGLAWHTQNILYASEHGPIAYDEINSIEPGANYGWPLVKGDEKTEAIEVKKPILHSGEVTWAPSGIAFVNQGPWQGKLLVANLRGTQLLVISLDEEGLEVEQVEFWLQNEYGRLREVIQSRDGSIYLATSNRDGRGEPDTTDDKIIRLIPKRSDRF